MIILVFSVFITEAMPRYVREEDKISFTTYFYPYVFTYSKDDVKALRDPDMWTEIVREGTLEKKIFDSSTNRFYINNFVIGFAKKSLDTVLLTENYDESGFTEEKLTRMKVENLNVYIENFRRGYYQAHEYLKKSKDPEETLDEIYYVKEMIAESSEALSFDYGYMAGRNFFEPVFREVSDLSVTSEKATDFIRSYSFSLGMISYIRTYYTDE